MHVANYIGVENVEVTEDDSASAWALWDTALVQGDLQVADHSAPPEMNDTAVAQEDCALEVIHKNHAAVAQAIRSFWGHPECCAFIETLLLNGTNEQQQNRCGFSQEVAACMLRLINIHDQLFGSLKGNRAADTKSWF